MKNTCNTSEFYCTVKKSIQEAILQNDNDNINVPKPNDLKSRSIVAGSNSPTQVLNSLVEKILKLIVPCLTTYMKDSWYFM